ncbi:MAG: ankyrin repeat domain-containing protein [Bacteroidales bacterium]
MKALLFEACQNGDLEKARVALQNGVVPNIRNEEGWMPIHYAAENGYDEIISLLLEAGADINALNSAGFTPFQVLMICEHYSPLIVGQMIQAGARVGTPLHQAILLNDPVETEQLIRNRKFVDAADDLGNTPLHLVVAVNNSALIVPLLEAGAPIDAFDMYETTPLQEACAMGQLYAASLLMNNGANPEHPDYNGRSALIFAAGNAHYELTDMLLQTGVAINQADHFGNTALHYAYENEEFEIADLLLQYGADDALKNEDGLTPVQMIPNYS